MNIKIIEDNEGVIGQEGVSLTHGYTIAPEHFADANVGDWVWLRKIGQNVIGHIAAREMTGGVARLVMRTAKGYGLPAVKAGDEFTINPEERLGEWSDISESGRGELYWYPYPEPSLKAHEPISHGV